MYCLCDSAMIRDFEELAAVPGKERDSLVVEMGRCYVLGYVAGKLKVSGAGRNELCVQGDGSG